MTYQDKLFDGQQVLVVGGTSGIGAGIAAAFLATGARVLLTGATPADLELAASDASLQGAGTAQLDVRDDAAVVRQVEACGQLHVLVNCAGMIRRGEELKPEVFASVLDVNLNGTMRACAAARAMLAETQGSIINIASMLSFFGGGLVPAYSASKGGVAQLTKSLAIAWADDGIRVNALAPGSIDTDMMRANTPQTQKRMAASSLQGRAASPDEMVGPALFLASDAASFVTGQVVIADGGLVPH